jgi:hypothetical protein
MASEILQKQSQLKKGKKSWPWTWREERRSKGAKEELVLSVRYETCDVLISERAYVRIIHK